METMELREQQIKQMFNNVINNIHNLSYKELLFKELDLLMFIVSLSIKDVSLVRETSLESRELICSSMSY